MFFLSLGLGGLFLVIVHHLFDASWSIPTRRVCEHLSCLLFPTMGVLFLPLAVLAPKIYPWMGSVLQANPDHALRSKMPLFTIPGYYISAAACFISWWLVSSGLRKWSLKQDVAQDEKGTVECTRKMRRYAAFGVFLFGFSLTMAAIMWMKALTHEWFSTMYGVCYFASSVWTTLATVWVITAILQRNTALRGVVKEKTYYMIGSLLFAFTVFYAYVTFAQYFIIWNANMPEETFWFNLRERGTWWDVGMIIIFGHFFVPFLALLRIDLKLKLWWMIPLVAWVWLMQFWDMEYQIMPTLHADGVTAGSLLADVACLMFIGGVLTKVFLKSLSSHPLFPQRDPRIAEAMDVYVPPAIPVSTAPEHAK